MDFRLDGFLSEDIERWRLEKRALYADRFKLVTGINQTGQRLVGLLGQVSRTIQNLFTCAFYVRALQSYQGAVLMAERGLITEAMTLARSTLETLFFLTANRLDEKFGQDLGRAHVKQVNKVAGAHVKAMGNPHDEASKNLQTAMNYLKEQGVEPADLQIFTVAQKAGMEQLYRTDYAAYSTHAAHPSVLALDAIWDKPNPMAEPTGILWGPDKGEKTDLPDVLLQVALVGIMVISEMNKLVESQPISDELERHIKLHLEQLQSGPDAPLGKA